MFILSFFTITVLMDVSKDEATIPVMNEITSTKVFKIGAFKDEDTAEKEASLKKGIVISNNGTFEVIIGILNKAPNIERLITYLDKKNIYYYIEDITITPGFLDTLKKYEDLMMTANSSVSFLQLNKKILERYKVLYEG